jgi:hypothetical protein
MSEFSTEVGTGFEVGGGFEDAGLDGLEVGTGEEAGYLDPLSPTFQEDLAGLLQERDAQLLEQLGLGESPDEYGPAVDAQLEGQRAEVLDAALAQRGVEEGSREGVAALAGAIFGQLAQQYGDRPGLAEFALEQAAGQFHAQAAEARSVEGLTMAADLIGSFADDLGIIGADPVAIYAAAEGLLPAAVARQAAGAPEGRAALYALWTAAWQAAHGEGAEMSVQDVTSRFNAVNTVERKAQAQQGQPQGQPRGDDGRFVPSDGPLNPDGALARLRAQAVA